MPGTVYVACMMPHGLILRVFDMVDWPEPLPGGGTKTVQMAKARPQTVTLKGYLQKYSPDSPPPVAKNGHYTITHHVGKSFFELWLSQNRDLDALKNGLILYGASLDDLQAKIRENEKRRCGLEPIDRSSMPKGIGLYKKEEAA